MRQIIVEVMPKPKVLDPQDKTAGSALSRLGITSLISVRQDKYFHLNVEGPVTEELLAQACTAAEEVFLDSITEDVMRIKALPEEEAK